MEEILKGLNGEQREAVTATEGYVRVVAGAGSGKTGTLARRFVWLCEGMGVAASGILCVTFTNKAAAEMKKRIRTLLPDRDTGFVTTFHGFCVTLLKEDCHAVRYPKTFTVQDDEDKNSLLRTVFEDLGITARDTTVREMSDYIGEFKGSHDYVPTVLCPEAGELLKLSERALGLKDRILYRYLYEQRKCYGLDFDDLMYFTLHILRTNGEIREKWQRRIEYMMIDEFHDVDKDEYALTELLTAYHRNLFVVGDPDQTIYTWRGADPRFLLEFDRRHEPCRTIFLNRNYRSVPQVLAASNALIRHNSIRLEKSLTAVRPDGEKPLYFHGRTQGEEANWIVGEIARLRDGGMPLRQMAVLYRAHYVSRHVEEALIREKIPYALYSGVEFYHRREVKDVICYLRMLESGDDVSFLRTVNEPRRNIGKKRIAYLRERADREGTTLLTALERSADEPIFHATRAEAYLRMLQDCRVMKDVLPVAELMTRILEESGYEQMLRDSGDTERLENLAELKQAVAEYEAAAGEEVSLSEYLARAALFTNLDQGERPDCVKLMTVHAAKGLEFSSVFLTGLSEGIFPTKRTLTREKLEEERRLCYVAMTRARDRLYLSDAAGMQFDGGFRYPSRFIFNAGSENVEFVRPLDPDLARAVRDLVEETERFDDGPGDGETEFVPGDRVLHPILGEGEVLEVRPREGVYSIRFLRFPTPRSIRCSMKLTRR